ncbi:hypothetical protein AFLA_011198 [Aspergillus flavus NRRL3357]|nr:hypothetical protein AFLA_011198 [Aspergillus flavus NRRL3357]
MDPTICVSFATVKRDGYDYFEASVGSLLEGLDPRERSALCLNILFRDTDPSRNPSWGQKWTDRLVDKTGSYDASEEEFSHLQELEKARNFHEKGIFDCIYSLRICTTTNASYIAIFEEDNIIADGWMVKTLKALSDISYRSTQNPWIYLRLFYTETLMRVVEMNTYGCCTQGLVFPREQVDGLITFLKDIKTGQTDFIIEEYADMARLTQYALVPQQLQHVGLKSSRDTLEIYTGSTWAFWFEENDPAKLKRVHEDFLQHPDIQRMLGHV